MYPDLDQENYLNTNFAYPDYATNIFMVPKRKEYCWANFLFYILNPSENLQERTDLFTDYSPSNSLKYELSKKFTIKNNNFYKTKMTRK